jgi:predicted PurR-regulated permease PerM
MPPVDDKPARAWHASPVVTCALVLTLLYLAREVLVPIALAAMLSLAIAPLVTRFKRLGLPRAPSVLLAVGLLTAAMSALALAIGMQVVAMAGSLPQYESSIRAKVAMVRDLTVGRVESVQGAAGRLFRHLSEMDHPTSSAEVLQSRARNASGVVPVEVREPDPTPMSVVRHVAASIWGPVETAGIVLIVLLFILLEHEALRDRMIRLMGRQDLQATTLALNDVGARLSRFFVSQFAVNFGVGAVIWLGLLLVGLPHAMLWAVLTAILRFVPYVGVALAAVLAGLLAAAVDPGWSLMCWTLALFAVVEVLAAQVVEPLLYGHSTGLSPLSVVVATIFWSWIWGPVGLLLSTPLTLCLLVAGRYVPGLDFLDILLGDGPSLTLPQRFYQRALSGDAHDLITQARAHLKRQSFAHYCDVIVLPALQLAGRDFERGLITPEQSQLLQRVIVQVIGALEAQPRQRRSLRRQRTVLDMSNPGLALRQQREAAVGPWQGPIVVPAGTLNLCVGQGGIGDELLTELLARALRDAGLDARHVSCLDLDKPPPGASADSVAHVFVQGQATPVSTKALMATMREAFPHARIVLVYHPDLVSGHCEEMPEGLGCARVLSFSAAVELVLHPSDQRSFSSMV